MDVENGDVSEEVSESYNVDSEGVGGAKLMAVIVKEVVAMNKLVRLGVGSSGMWNDGGNTADNRKPRRGRISIFFAHIMT